MTGRFFCVLTFFAFFFAADCLASAAPGTLEVPSKHPYVYADKAKFRSLAKSKDATVAELRAIVLAEADKSVAAVAALPERPALVPKSPSNLGVMRAAQGRLLYLSAAYNLTSDKKYSDAARVQLARLCALEDWGTSHFLDIGECALGVGVAYDWLYSVLSDDEKRAIERAIVEKAFAPSYLVEDGPSSWMKGNFNWNQVCHGGLAVAALAIYRTCPDQCRPIIERAAECVPYATASYAPDGAFPEGPSYWEYGTSFQVLLIDAMMTSLGQCYGLDEYEGFLKTPNYRIQVCGNTGLEYSYSDYHKSFYNEPVMMWFAKRLGRSDLVADELGKIRKVAAAGTPFSRQTVFDLLWWTGLEPSEQEAPTSLSAWFARGRMPLAVMRTDAQHNDAYAAFKGGTADNSHGHMDSGSFIYESQGVRWALDLGTENYDRMRSAGLDLWNYQPQSTRWTTFRPSSESHNVLRINGRPLVSTALASDMTFSESPELCSATLDMTPLYSSSNASSVRRTVSLAAYGDLCVTDEAAVRGGSVLIFQWLTDADAELCEGGVRLTKDGKTILLSAPDANSIHIEDVSHVPGIQNSPNPGVKRILFVKKVNSQPARLQVNAFNR